MIVRRENIVSKLIEEAVVKRILNNSVDKKKPIQLSYTESF